MVYFIDGFDFLTFELWRGLKIWSIDKYAFPSGGACFPFVDFERFRISNSEYYIITGLVYQRVTLVRVLVNFFNGFDCLSFEPWGVYRKNRGFEIWFFFFYALVNPEFFCVLNLWCFIMDAIMFPGILVFLFLFKPSWLSLWISAQLSY